MEAALCCLTLREAFVPVSINITELDPEADGVRIVTSPVDVTPKNVRSDSSAFGGSNVTLVFRKAG